jgi:two-component system sensor histidine kinase/response regulator
LTVPEILSTLQSKQPKLTLAPTKAYYHLRKLNEQGLLEQYPKRAPDTKTRVRGRHFRTSAKFFVEVTVEASVGYSGEQVMPEEIGPRFAELAEAVRSSGVASSMEYQVDLDGVLLWVSMTMSRHSDGMNIVAVVRDITTHRTLEERLERSEVEFGRLVEESFQGYAIFQDGVPVFVNPAYARTVGRTQNELNLMTPNDTKNMIHPDDRHILEDRETDLGRGVDALPRQRFRYIRPDGTIRWVESFGRKTEHLGRPALLTLEIDITEQIQAEMELQRSEQRNRIIVDAMSDLVLLYDNEGRYLEYFAKDESLLVRPWDEMRGRKIEEVYQKTVSDQYYEHLAQLQMSGGSITYEFEMEIDGTMRWFQATMMHQEDKQGVVEAVKDISDRKAAEEEVKRSERRFREIFDSSPVAIGRCNLDGAFVEMNQTFLNLFGIASTEDAPGYRITNDPHVPSWALNQVQDGGFVTFDVTYDFDLVRKRNLYKTSNIGTGDLIVALTPLNLPEDSPEAGYLVMVQDVTERLRAEEALRDSEERYRAFFEQAGDSIIISDPLSSNIIDFNRQAHEALGYTEDEFKKLKLWELEAVASEEDVEKRIMEVAEKGSLIYETKMRSKTGSVRDVRVSSRIVTFRDRMINQSIITDVTDEKKIQESLKASEEKYKSLFDSSVDAITLLKDGKILDLNQSALKIFGCNQEEIIGKTLWSLSPRKQPDGTLSKDSATSKIERALSGEPQLYYWRHRRCDGSDFDAFIGLSPIKYDGEDAIQSVIRLEVSEHFQLLGG